MNEIRTRIVVGPDHRIVGTGPVALPPGEHEVTITLAAEAARTRAERPFDLAAFPSHGLGALAGRGQPAAGTYLRRRGPMSFPNPNLPGSGQKADPRLPSAGRPI